MAVLYYALIYCNVLCGAESGGGRGHVGPQQTGAAVTGMKNVVYVRDQKRGLLSLTDKGTEESIQQQTNSRMSFELPDYSLLDTLSPYSPFTHI